MNAALIYRFPRKDVYAKFKAESNTKDMRMPAAPVNQENAIDAAAFVVLFNRPFTEKEETSLLALKEIFRDELPDFSRTTMVTVKHEAGRPPEHVVKESGLRLQKFEPSGKVGWVLNILENQLVITCQSYDRWNNVWAQSEKYMKAALRLLDINSLSVQACMLQYVDRFIEKSSSAYTTHDVFDKKTSYLTAKAATAGKLWHVHQGWFEERSPDERILNILNMGTTEDRGNIVTTIDHSLQLQFLPKPKPAKRFFDAKKEYQKAFLILHEKNKDVVKSLLNSNQRKAVGLT